MFIVTSKRSEDIFRKDIIFILFVYSYSYQALFQLHQSTKNPINHFSHSVNIQCFHSIVLFVVVFITIERSVSNHKSTETKFPVI